MPAPHLPCYYQLPVPKLYMEGYFIRALKGRKCHFVLTKTFRKKTGCKLFREKVTFYSAGERDGEKKVHFLPSLCVEKNCRRVKASCLPKWLPVASQFSPVFTKQSGCEEKWIFGLPFLGKEGHMELQRDFLVPTIKAGFGTRKPLTADLSTFAGRSSAFPLWRVLAFFRLVHPFVLQ